jgi:hypothetical protein
MKPTSAFRVWIYNIWMDNREERLTFNETPVTIKEYWNNYKWWIKREYRHQSKR